MSAISGDEPQRFASTEYGPRFQVEARIGRNLPAAPSGSLPRLFHWFEKRAATMAHFVHKHEIRERQLREISVAGMRY
jgi:hypothetical protein